MAHCLVQNHRSHWVLGGFPGGCGERGLGATCDTLLAAVAVVAVRNLDRAQRGTTHGLRHFNVVHQEGCMNNRSLTIRLDQELDVALDAACAATGRSRGEIVRDALRRQLQLMRFERLRSQALPFGEAAGWLTDEDVFAAVS